MTESIPNQLGATRVHIIRRLRVSWVTRPFFTEIQIMNNNPLHDLADQHWLRKPTMEQMESAIKRLSIWNAAGWAAAMSLGAAFLWVIARG